MVLLGRLPALSHLVFPLEYDARTHAALSRRLEECTPNIALPSVSSVVDEFATHALALEYVSISLVNGFKAAHFCKIDGNMREVSQEQGTEIFHKVQEWTTFEM